VENLAGGIILGLCAAILIYGSFHYAEYLTFRLMAVLAVNAELAAGTDGSMAEMGPAFVDYMLKEETGYPGFVGYVLYTAEEGITVSRKFGLRTIHLETPITWMYWGIELVIIGGMTVFAGKSGSDREDRAGSTAARPGKFKRDD
jgi:hypothetical protein